MDDILSFLDEASKPDTREPEYFKAAEGLNPFYDAIQKAFSLAYLDALNDAESGLIKYESRQSFTRGFYLGEKIMSTILTPAGPAAPDSRHRS